MSFTPRRGTAAIVCAALASLFSGPTSGQSARPSIDAVLNGLDRVASFRETALSPNGARVAWVVDEPAASGGGTAVYVGNVPSTPSASRPSAPGRVSAGATRRGAHEYGVAWSPDGTRLAYLSDAGHPGQPQLYVTDMTGAAPRPLTHATGQMAHPLWAPDGQRIAFLFVAGSSQATGALVAYKPDAGVVGDSYDEQRIAVVDAAGGALREASPANMFVYDYDWSPDGKSLAAEAVEGSGTDNYWTAQLYVMDAASGAARSIWKPPLQIAQPRWSPDGESIAVIHGLMSDEGQTGGDVYLVPAAGGAPKNVTPDTKTSIRAIDWRTNGTLVAQAYENGKSLWMELVPRAISWTNLTAGEQQFSATAVARRGPGGSPDPIVSAIVQSFGAPPEVYAGPAGSWTQMTTTNAGVKPIWGAAKSLNWKSDAFTIQGWLVCPATVAPAAKLPLVVSVHGGPSSAQMSAWPTRWNAVLPTQGYCVLMPNPRGSYGGGEAFTQANVKDFGYGDFRDILAGVDAAVAEGPVDLQRVGIIGWSYGGYMSMWAVTQTTRFKAAVAGAGLANWQSYYGENRIDQWMMPFFGASVYDDPEVYARSSPITFIKKAKTPTLVLHGDRDSEVPTPQGYEFWHALKALGVPTELVIYPGEGHGFAKVEDQHDVERRLVAWFDKYLK